MKFAKRLSIIVIVIIVVITCCLFLLGSYNKSNSPDEYSNKVSELIEEFKDDYAVTFPLNEKWIMQADESFAKENEEIYENAPLIIKCKLAGEIMQLYNCIEQEITVLEVYRGDEKLVGENIKFTSTFSFIHSHKYIARSSVNFMNKGDEYLLFLYPFGYSLNTPGGVKGGDVYTVSDFNQIPYFNLSEVENIVSADKFPIYSEVMNNEFFVIDQFSLDWALEFKENIINKYVPKS